MNSLFLVVAPSGAGKSTLINEIFEPEQKILSVTTRPLRKGEVDGEDYYFITEEEFKHLQETDGLVQEAEYVGNKYGVTKKELQNKLSDNDVVLAVVAESYITYKELYPDIAVGIFLDISKEVVKQRLENRNDGKEIIEKRLKQYDVDIKNKELFKNDSNAYIINVDDYELSKNVNKFKKVISDVQAKR